MHNNHCGNAPEDNHCYSHEKHCSKQEILKLPSWQCGVPQAKGTVMHEGHLYVNLVEGNLVDPALGVGAGTYAGAFDLHSLIQYVIANP